MSVKKKLIIAVGVLIALVMMSLVIIYMVVSSYFMNHFYVGTTINGVDVSKYTVEEAEEAIQALIENYELVIDARGDISDTISGEEINLAVDWNNLIGEFQASQNGYDWLLKLNHPDKYEVPLVVVYNEEKLMTVLEGLNCFAKENQIAPSEARISEYDPENGYKVIAAVQGTTIVKDIVVDAVKKDILELKTKLDLESLDCYLKPEAVDETKLQATVDQLNKALGTVITYEIGESVRVLDKDTIFSWISVDDNMEMCINEEEVDAFVNKMYSSYTTCYRAKNLMTSYGQEVTISKSYYGWKVDKAAEKAALLDEIQNGAVVNRDLHYSMTANSHEGNDFGNSYVEINLTAQHIFLYIDGELIVESDFVSGDLASGNATPTGAFSLTYKKKDAVLNGADYSTPVTYWMPFFGNYGMHDATWRSSFGASIYKRDGSHGCVNLPKKVAKVIFENIDKGFPVLCYELPGTESEKGIAQDQAYVVIDAINAIGTVTVDSEAAILSARGQYDVLSDMAKGYVTNYKKLLNAEKEFELIRPEQSDKENSNPDVTMPEVPVSSEIL